MSGEGHTYWFILCDRGGMLLVSDKLVEGLLPLARVPAPALMALADIADRSVTGGVEHLAVPGLAAAGKDSDAALDAVMAFQERLGLALAAFGKTIH